MCKIAVVTGVKESKKLAEFIMTIKDPLTRNDKDGFGYATTNGSRIYAERWVRPVDAFRVRNPFTKNDRIACEKYGEAITVEQVYQAIGRPIGKPCAAIVHGRMATCSKSIENTHPFVTDDGKTALIHNGVISNAMPFLQNSTCDSEALLNRYTDFKVNENPEKIGEAFGVLEGYYALGVIGFNNGKVFVDVVKDDRAQLYLCVVPEFGDVFCTSAEVVREVCGKLKWKQPTVYALNSNQHIRLDARSGNVQFVNRLTVERKARTYTTAEYQSRSYYPTSWEDTTAQAVMDLRGK